MSSLDNEPSAAAVAEALRRARRRGVRLWAENGELRYRSPKGALTAAEISNLASLRGQIVAFLERAASTQNDMAHLQARQLSDCVPLTFSQLSYWRNARLGERRAWRAVAAALRVRGRLDVRLLQDSVTEVVNRHEALRTQIVVEEGVPIQKIAPAGRAQLTIDDLTGLPVQHQATEVQRLMHELILEPVDVAVGPLFASRLMKLTDDEHVLFVTTEHIVSDAASVNVLLRDLLWLYRQALTGEAASLPTISIQFADYAVWQRRRHASWLERHGTYWTRHLAGCERLRLPGQGTAGGDVPTWGAVPVRIDRVLKQALREWARLWRTTPGMAIFTAFVALVLRSCDASDGVIRYQTDGRFSPLLENSIGYFACALNLRVELQDDDTFIALLNRVTQEYCSATDHADFSFMSSLDAESPRSEVAGNPGFNWVPRAPGVLPAEGPDNTPAVTPFKFSIPSANLEGYPWDWEPSLILFDYDDAIEGRVLYSPRRTSENTARVFVQNFLTLLTQLLSRPDRRVQEVALLEPGEDEVH